jgi:hypothetical protein
LRVEDESDAAGHPWLPFDESSAMQCKDHLVNRRWRYVEVALEICFRRRASMDGGIGVDKSQILALLFGKAGYEGRFVLSEV